MAFASLPSSALVDSPDSCYLALKARDARFDGRFFTGVASTGIYCRPVCRVRTPRRENCRFFRHAAQAEQAGFRPCLRCRPELAPADLAWSIQDASDTLALQAARLFDEPDAWAHGPTGVDAAAQRLGISDRHLRRLFEARFGVTPLQYLQTRRLLTAKQLLTDTTLPVTQVALASGFASLRRFNAAFKDHYGLSPTRLRRHRESDAGGRAPDAAPTRASDDVAQVRLGYRPPYDIDAMVDFLRARAVAGVEDVVGHGPAARYRRTLDLRSAHHAAQGWYEVGFDAERHQLLLRVSEALLPALPTLIRRVRAQFDLDADPVAIGECLMPQLAIDPGLRVPGAIDGFELAVRAILGQQVTVAAARTLVTRLVQRFGRPLTTRHAGLTHLFPAPEALLEWHEQDWADLGITRARQRALTALAAAMHGGVVALQPGADVQETLKRLCALPGIGPWTAQYIAMRALRWPDAFPSGDVALHHALGLRHLRSPPAAARAAEQLAQAWRPWRSYAVLHLWRHPDGYQKG